MQRTTFLSWAMSVDWVWKIIWNYLNIVYIVHYVHINCLFQNQPLMHLLYITHCIIFSFAFWHKSVPSSGCLIFNCWICRATTGHTICPNMLVKCGLLTDELFSRFHEVNLWWIIVKTHTHVTLHIGTVFSLLFIIDDLHEIWKIVHQCKGCILPIFLGQVFTASCWAKNQTVK